MFGLQVVFGRDYGKNIAKLLSIFAEFSPFKIYSKIIYVCLVSILLKIEFDTFHTKSHIISTVHVGFSFTIVLQF